MAPSHKLIKTIEQCKIRPLPRPASQPPLSLTFFDVVFLRFPPVQRLFFYDYPHPVSQFLDSELPNLKHSLALTLHHFYPFAGTLLINTQNPAIRFSGSDFVRFTVAVSHASFHELSADHPRPASDLHISAPPLVSSGNETSILSVQVTVFPNAGIGIGTTVHHAVADGSTYTNFIKAWASLCSSGSSSVNLTIDRSLIRDPKCLLSIFLKDLETLRYDQGLQAWDLYGHPNAVRATFVFDREQLSKLGSKTPVKCSPYSLACGYVWATLVKVRSNCSSEIKHFGFVTGCRARHDPPLPADYFGNCLGICRVEAKRSDLVAENGVTVAAEAIWRVIKGLEEGVFERAEDWIKDVFDYASKKALTVAGSPKLGIYGVDFGWGRPRKVEVVSIERTGALSLAESRDGRGGIEAGLVLPKYEMDKFIDVFFQGLVDVQ